MRIFNLKRILGLTDEQLLAKAKKKIAQEIGESVTSYEKEGGRVKEILDILRKTTDISPKRLRMVGNGLKGNLCAISGPAEPMPYNIDYPAAIVKKLFPKIPPETMESIRNLCSDAVYR